MTEKKEILTAHRINLEWCDEGHAHFELLDEDGNVFAEAILDMEQALDIGLEMVEMADDECDECVPEGATVQ